jgi:predicted PurR-regulated permease PerM
MANSTKQVLLLLAGLALLVGLIWLLALLWPLLVALTIAALLAYLLNPLVVWLERRMGGKRPLAATLIYIILLALLAGPLALLTLALIERWALVQGELQEALSVMQSWFLRPLPLFGFVLYPELLLENLRVALGNALSSLTLGDGGLLSGLTQNLLWALVVLVSLYYLLRDGHHLKPWLLAQVPAPHQADAQQLVAEIDAVWGLFLRVQLLIFAVLAVLIGSGTTLILWLFRQGWLPLSPLGLALLLVAMYAAIQQVDNLWLRPQLMGHALKLHPGVIFVGLIAGLALSGFLGALLIVPLLATAKAIARFGYGRLSPLWQEQTSPAPDQEE